MGVENFIPELWTSAVQVPLQKALIYGALANREFEGELSQSGDKVKISEIGRITINNYTRKGALTWQNPDSADKWLLIDQQKSFSFTIDDLDAAQAKPELASKYMTNAAYELADDMDGFLAGLYGSAGLTVTALTVTAANVLTNLTDIDYALNNGNVNKSEPRYMPVHSRYHRLLLQATTGIIGHTGVPKVMNDGTLINGSIGQLFGINLLLSNNVTESSSNVFQHMCFTSDAIAMAQQVSKVEAVNREDYFDMGIKGLQLYGGKIVRPDKVAVCATTISA